MSASRFPYMYMQYVFVKTKWNPVLSDPEKQVVVLTVKPGNAK